MREILFRGKRLDNGEWVYGYPVGWQNEGGDISIVDSRFGACIDESGNLMMLEAPFVTKVAPSTVGQYTGLTDKNGKKIFEGDILHAYIPKQGIWSEITLTNSPVYYDGASFRANQTEHPMSYVRLDSFSQNNVVLEVAGNIHDNPELLKEATND